MDLAFRHMAQGKHVGKIVLKIRPEEPNPVAIPKPLKISAVSRALCDPASTYLLVGGLGGIGMQLANFLINRGARKFCLTSKSGLKSNFQKRLLVRWRSKGIHVEISTKNAANEIQAEELIRDCKKLGPIGGIFQCAAVLRDGMFENQTVDDFFISAEAKYYSTKTLDKICRRDSEIQRSLRWFVVFSSVACGRGNAGTF